MAMSKELCVDLEVVQPDTKTDGWLLTRVASRLYPDPHKLRRFALLLGIDDDTYCTIQEQAEVSGQGLPLQVSILIHC